MPQQVAAIVLGLLTGCSFGLTPIPDPGARLRSAEDRAREAGFERVRTDEGTTEPAEDDGEPLPIASWLRRGRACAGLHVYIEGDGLAWKSRHRVSEDPTPVEPIGLELAIADPSSASVLYVGRPCQYGFSTGGPCRPRLWTAARFGEEVIDAMDRYLARLLPGLDLEDEPLHLVGYSGGGVVAALVAARRIVRRDPAMRAPAIGRRGGREVGRPDRAEGRAVANLVTIAAPLDVESWTRLAGVSRLTASLSPMDRVESLRRLRQHHLAGSEDRRVPLGAIAPFHRALGPDAPSRLDVIGGMDHRAWPGRWAEIVSRKRLFEDPVAPPSRKAMPSRP